MCGENPLYYFSESHHIGSPPRVRGKRKTLVALPLRTRITPACAGKTGDDFEVDEDDEDHPRVCGENLWTFSTDDMRLGSPPRVRGKPYLLGDRSH